MGKTALYFAKRLFFCGVVEGQFWKVLEGVKEVCLRLIRAVRKKKNPTYEDVGLCRTTQPQAVEVLYDPKVIFF